MEAEFNVKMDLGGMAGPSAFHQMLTGQICPWRKSRKNLRKNDSYDKNFRMLWKSRTSYCISELNMTAYR